MVDLVGPAAAGAINTLSTTTDVTDPVVGDTWYQDCIGGDASAGTPTPIVAKWLNWVMQQLRAAIRFSNVPQSNAYDYMLSWAMQSGYANWVGSFGGSANALTGVAPNAPIAVQVGTLIRGIASATNTGAATFNWASLGAQPVVTIGGAALVGGEIVASNGLVLMWTGSAWMIVSCEPLPYLKTIIQEFNSFTTTDVGAVIIAAQSVNSSGTGGPTPGTTASWGGGVTGLGNQFQFGAYLVYASDNRWLMPTPYPPGTWQVAGIATGDCDSGSAVVTTRAFVIQRIA